MIAKKNTTNVGCFIKILYICTIILTINYPVNNTTKK